MAQTVTIITPRGQNIQSVVHSPEEINNVVSSLNPDIYEVNIDVFNDAANKLDVVFQNIAITSNQASLYQASGYFSLNSTQYNDCFFVLTRRPGEALPRGLFGQGPAGGTVQFTRPAIQTSEDWRKIVIYCIRPRTISAPPPPPIGHGQVFIPFYSDDLLVDREITTEALWSNNNAYLTAPATASLAISASVNYCLDVYDTDPDSDPCSEVQFSIVYADYSGSGDTDAGGLDNETVTKALYSQYANVLLPKGQDKFSIDGIDQDYVYIIDVKRARYKDLLDPGNLQLTLSSVGFSSDASNSILANMQTGSALSGSSTFIDDSGNDPLPFNYVDKTYNLKIGTIEDGIGSVPTAASASADTGSFGLVYPNHGMVVLSGTKLDSELGFNTNRNTQVNGYNTYRLYHSLKLVTDNALTDTSGDALGFYGRAVSMKHNNMCFVRVRNSILNHSNNPTFVTGSEGDISSNMLNTNQNKAYFTSIGIYNNDKDLLAVGKISKPILSTNWDESLFIVKIRH